MAFSLLYSDAESECLILKRTVWPPSHELIVFSATVIRLSVVSRHLIG